MIKTITLYDHMRNFFQLEAASGIVLFFCSIVAIGLANSPFQDNYSAVWTLEFGRLSLLQWINDGLMAIFFFVVGIEIKREFLNGELSSRKKAVLPIIAAIGGMLVPALLYLGFNWTSHTSSGWGIPMATDIAFCMGVLSLFGNRIQPSLKIFLLALAIVDDLGAVLVIAVFYTHHLDLIFLLVGLGILTLLSLVTTKLNQNIIVYLVSGILIWICFLKSGIHPTIAGVLLAIVIPLNMGIVLERKIHPWVAFGIIPIFALANAGVSINHFDFSSSVSLGVILGLIFGKQIGITLFSWLAVRTGIAYLPTNVSWNQIYGVAALCGIGFTMSIFIANLSFTDLVWINQAKVAIFCASVLSACVGAFVLKYFSKL